MTGVKTMIMNCPKCGSECSRDEVGVGVGIMYGPYGCGNCGWSEVPEYDHSDGKEPTTEDGLPTDQWGGAYP